MVSPNDEVVKVASGTLVQVEIWHNALSDAGIFSQVVGDDLGGGLGSTLANSVQLYVRGGDEPAAVAVLERVEAEKGAPVPESPDTVEA